MGLAGHAMPMRRAMQNNLHSFLDQPERCDVVDDLNEEPVLVLLNLSAVTS
jgi:hypothetical protein